MSCEYPLRQPSLSFYSISDVNKPKYTLLLFSGGTAADTALGRPVSSCQKMRCFMSSRHSVCTPSQALHRSSLVFRVRWLWNGCHGYGTAAIWQPGMRCDMHQGFSRRHNVLLEVLGESLRLHRVVLSVKLCCVPRQNSPTRTICASSLDKRFS